MIVSCYLLVFMSCIVLSLLFTRWVRNFATTRGWVAPPELDRHVHTRSVPRIGGVSIFVSFMLVASVAMLLPRWTGITLAMPDARDAQHLGSRVHYFFAGPLR